MMKLKSFKQFLVEEYQKNYTITKNDGTYIVTFKDYDTNEDDAVFAFTPTKYKGFYYLKLIKDAEDNWDLHEYIQVSFLKVFEELKDVIAFKADTKSFPGDPYDLIKDLARKMAEKFYVYEGGFSVVVGKDNEFIDNIVKESDKKSYSVEDVKKAGELILKNCRPFLQQINYNLDEYALYRGIGINEKKLFIELSARLTNRHPSATPLKIHKFLNKQFENQFGHPFRNAVFATGDPGVAEYYSKEITNEIIPRFSIYSIFPIGEFEYIWSPDILDLYDKLGEFDYGDITLSKKVKEYIMDEIIPSYKNTDLLEAIKSGHEIMLWCEKYYGLLDETQFQKDVFEYIKYNK